MSSGSPSSPPYRARIVALIAFVAGASACADRDAGAGDPRHRAPAGAGDPAHFLTHLADQAAFASVQGEGGEVKYLLSVDGRTPPAPLGDGCYFQNTERYPLHLAFLHSFPELVGLDFSTYLTLVMRQASRALWAGELRLFSAARHPRTGKTGVLAYFLYSESGPAEALSVEQIAAVDARLKRCVPYARDLLVLTGMDEPQMSHFVAQAPALRARGVDTADWTVLRPDRGAEGYSLGEGYGYLRVYPRGQRPADAGPRDVVVAESAAEDLGLVAGLVTALPQNLHSHVNLRLREKRIPNASLPDVYANQVVSLLAGRLVRVTVAEARVDIEPATLAAAQSFWQARQPRIALPPADLAEARVRDLRELAAPSAVAYGAKAANLAELQRILPEESRTPGFAVPFSAYRDFVAGAEPAARLTALLDDPAVALDPALRRQRLAALRAAIEAEPLPSALLARLADAASAAFGAGYATTPIRFRSSSNVEDGTQLSGAGLHDSARGCFTDDTDGDDRGPSACLAPDEAAALTAELARRRAELAAHPERSWLLGIVDDLEEDLSRERPVARAVKKVWASLWNDRAFEDRDYFGIDQRAAFMGIAVEPSFVLERLDAVATTNLDADPRGALHRVISQIGGHGVVRPADPTEIPETLTFRRGAGGTIAALNVITTSSLAGGALWPAARLEELAGLLYLIQDHFAASVYPAIAPLALEMEIKLTRDDRIVVKQARPYSLLPTGEE